MIVFLFIMKIKSNQIKSRPCKLLQSDRNEPMQPISYMDYRIYDDPAAGTTTITKKPQ